MGRVAVIQWTCGCHSVGRVVVTVCIVVRVVVIQLRSLSSNSLNLDIQSFGLDIRIFVFEVLKDEIVCPWRLALINGKSLALALKLKSLALSLALKLKFLALVLALKPKSLTLKSESLLTSLGLAQYPDKTLRDEMNDSYWWETRNRRSSIQTCCNHESNRVRSPGRHSNEFGRSGKCQKCDGSECKKRDGSGCQECNCLGGYRKCDGSRE